MSFNPFKSAAPQSAATRLHLETRHPALAARFKAEAEAERLRAEKKAADFPQTNPLAINFWKDETRDVTMQMKTLCEDPLEAYAMCMSAGKKWVPPLNTFPGWQPKI